jgi:hypothetical protein
VSTVLIGIGVTSFVCPIDAVQGGSHRVGNNLSRKSIRRHVSHHDPLFPRTSLSALTPSTRSSWSPSLLTEGTMVQSNRYERLSRVVTAFFSAIFLVVSSQPADADTFVLRTFVGANLGCIPQVDCPESPDGDQDGTFGRPGPNNGAGLVTVTDADDGYDVPGFTYSAAADASFGRLHARASGSYGFSSEDDHNIRTAFAFALVTDQLTLNAPGLAGQPGILDVSFLLQGTLQTTGDGGAGVLAGVGWGNDPDAFSPNNTGKIVEYTTVPSGPAVVPVTFVWGQPFYFTLIMGVSAGTPIDCMLCDSGDAILSPAGIGNGSGTANFFDTLTLVAMVPKVNDNPVLNAQFISGSNARYGVNGIPEPGSLLLFGTGLALTFKRRRRG